ncbi:unnamed protein product [Penicillium salamii]|nr:unnamed protein product [Penicillium salamii]
MAQSPNSRSAGWRTPKACEECRKRKIRCNGVAPCETCCLRKTSCIYRDVIRHRKKKQNNHKSRWRDQKSIGKPAQGAQQTETSSSRETRQASPHLAHSMVPQHATIMPDLPKSVSASQMTSAFCQAQLYYGPSSHFALMQHIYCDLMSKPKVQLMPPNGVEEAGAGLDLFSFRRIFFGIPSSYDATKKSSLDQAVLFLPYELANLFLSRFLSTFFLMMPHCPEAHLKRSLDCLYRPSAVTRLDNLSRAIVLLSVATGSLGTDFFAWGDVLFEHVKASLIAFDDNEQGRPNPTYLHLGTAARKALSAGLHKPTPEDHPQTPEGVEERRLTFCWFCFHQGRPSSLALTDVVIEYPQCTFIRVLATLCKTVVRSRDEIYGQRHESLLGMFKVAESIAADMQEHQDLVKAKLGFALGSSIQAGSLGFQQTICSTLYYHTLLLTFRPFLLFCHHWRRDIHLPSSHFSKYRKKEPLWLSEACKYALTIARETIRQLCEVSSANDLIKQLRYNGYFIGSSAFTLIYDLLHDAKAAPNQMLWIHTSLQTLFSMRAGDPVTSIISAIETVLKRIDPSYKRLLYPKADTGCGNLSEWNPVTQQDYADRYSHFPSNDRQVLLLNSSIGAIPKSSMNQQNIPQLDVPKTMEAIESCQEFFAFTQSDVDQSFDFSTMNLESFFSLHQPGHTES